MSDNPFVLPTAEYKRDVNVLQHYIGDSATYLSIMTGMPVEDCAAFVRNAVKPGGEFAFKDPEVIYLERGENGDREKKQGTLSRYIADSLKDGELIAPPLTTYTPPHVKKSLLVDFIDGNVKARSVAKKAMFAAQVAGDKAMHTLKKIEQTNRKLSNNSISGAHVSASTPLYNKTAHSTLTSNCRSTSGYGNANNEKFLCGNRHYWSPDIVRNNIISIINHTDYDQMGAAMAQFGIRHPTADETMECITYSTKLYWSSTKELAKIQSLVMNLTPIQRSAFVYTGDLYHLMRFNDALVREFITKLSSRVGVVHPDPGSVLKSAPEDHVHLAAMLCPEEMKGKNLLKVKGTPAEGIVASTAEHIGQVLQEYRNLIRAFWVTPNVPASVAHFPDSVRRAAITSDTDSTIFSVQDWVIWHRGTLQFDAVANGVAATMIFLAAQTITHVLARMSANFGIEQSRLYQIAMKNEFYFPIFTPTQVAKHYFALVGAQEGNLFEEFEKEIKGVHLKSSNAPKAVMKAAQKLMEDIMGTIVEGQKVDIAAVLKRIGDIERDVINSIKKGSYEYFRKGQIKTPESYTKEAHESPYATYTMWEEVFAPKYGNSQPPPYMSVKVSCQLDSPSKTREWIENIKDRELAGRLEAWMKRTGKKHMGTTFLLPEQCIASRGIPEEILDAIGIRNIVLDTTKVFYLILETLGVYMLNKKMTRLVSDFH